MIGINVNVQSDVSKLQALDRQMKQLKSTYDALAKSAKQAGASFGQSIPGAQMPLAGSVVPPSGVALMPGMNPHASLAGSKMSPVMYGPAFRAQMHQMMPGHMAHQFGAASALTQLSNQHRSMTGSSIYASTGVTGVTGQLKSLATSIDNLTKALQHPAVAPSSPSNAGLNMNPYVSLQSESVALQAMNPIASVSYPARVQAKMTAAQNRVLNSAQPARTSWTSKAGQVLYRMAGGSYYGEMAGGAAVDALGIGGGLAGLGLTAGIGAGIGALMWGAHKVGQGYSNYVQTAQPISNLYHSAMPGMSFGAFYNQITNAGSGVGASYQQMAQAAQTLASTGGTAALSKSNLQAIANGAVGLGYGQNGVAQFASQMSELQRLGLTSGLSASTSNSKLMMLIGNASVQSGMQGRTSQLIDAMTSLTQSLDQQRSTPPNAADLLSMMTTLSKPIMGPNGYQYLQSTQGQRGANLLASVNNSLSHPGGGPAGSLLVYNWLTKGTNMSPFQEMYLAEQGLTGRLNGKGPTNLQRIVQGAMSSFPALSKGLTPTGTPTALQAMGLEQLGSVLGLSGHQTQLFLAQFTHNGHFSMANLNAEQNWWKSTFKGKMPNATWTVPAAVLYNAKNASDIKSVMTAMQNGGVTLSSTETSQLAQLQKLNPKSSQYSKLMGTLKTELGSQMIGTSMLTSQDANTKAIQQNTAAWTKVSRALQPFSTFINKLQAAIPKGGTGKGNQGAMPGSAPKYDQYGLMSYNYTGHQSNQFAVMDMMFAHPNAVAKFLNLSAPGGGNGWSGNSSPSIPAPSNVSRAGITQWSKYIQQAAAKYGIPANMIAAVMQNESGGKNGLTSSAGAQGLMQIMPSNDNAYGITNPWNPQQNINAGAKMLSQLYQKFHGNWSAALGAYNGGPGNAYGSAEQQYAATVEGIYQAFQKHSPIQVHVHVNPGTSSGTEQWVQPNPNIA
ncbi:lytic transglycosylase domain-containing protein [Alicyclobacillus tolerans]|uniref:lytic transglycosylase domain-containing protein n=1 Tax=Alicyclobacillus tolerans TaxID=90970 RepID=UPI001F2D276F|nr:lytic transglycosylase domain-containing protein [Alicyclobacillus tolerans]MCF8567721.1 lytic transglycosylase domain-containing protein [Alicyclobacillus tolerans]